MDEEKRNRVNLCPRRRRTSHSSDHELACYSRLAPQTTNNPFEFFKVARRESWLGYLSSPRLANANYGAQLQHYRSKRDNALALAILDGTLDERDIPRFSGLLTGCKEIVGELSDSAKNELARERKQREWMRTRGIE